MPTAERGFSLLEVLVALVLVGTVLLVAGGFYWQQVRTEERLAAGRRAELALVAAYELIRAGALPLAAGAVADPTGADVPLAADVEPSGTPGLVRLELVATLVVRGATVRRTLDALIFAP